MTKKEWEIREEMQKALDEAWNNPEAAAAWKEYFSDGQKPTVEEFIRVIAEKIRKEWNFKENEP